MMNSLKYSILVPVDHGGHFQERALLSLRQMDFPLEGVEVLVVGAGNDSTSKDIVKKEATLFSGTMTYVDCPESNRSRAMNTACEIGRGEVFVFIDDDCVIGKVWLKNLDDVFAREGDIGIVGGPDECDPEGPVFMLALDGVLNSLVGTGGLRRGDGPRTGTYYPRQWNMAVPREIAFGAVLKREGRKPVVFDEILAVHADVDLARRIERAGKRILFEPTFAIGHSRDTTFGSFVRRNFNMARGSRTLGVHRVPHVVLAVVALSACVLLPASRFVPAARYVLLSDAIVYVCILLAGAVSGVKRAGRLSVAWIIPILLLLLHLSRGTGYLFPAKRNISEVRE